MSGAAAPTVCCREIGRSTKPALVPALPRIIGAWIAFSLAVWALQEVPRGQGFVSLVLVLLVMASLPWLAANARRHRAQPGSGGERLLFAGVALFALGQIVFAILRALKPKVIDIADTTLAALGALARGGNPYALPIDPMAGGIANAAPLLHGYKYLPLMIAAYAPLGLPFGAPGIVLTNLLLHAATAALLGLLAARTSRAAGLAVALFYLSQAFLAHQLMTRGVNDLVAVLPLLAALSLVETRPGWTGFLVGLSIAAKLMPGLVALICLLPAPDGRARYAGGIALGLLPILPFLVWGPEAFLANILLFNAIRPVDDTAWLYGLPAPAAILARGVAVVALGAIAWRVARQPPALEQRCALLVLAILCVFAVGPDMHHNYYLWFIPPLALLAGRAALGEP